MIRLVVIGEKLAIDKTERATNSANSVGAWPGPGRPSP